jgi:hypothetical protein
MRASLFVLAAATILAAAVPVSGVSAQGVSIEGPGVGVRVGEPDRFRDRGYREDRIYRDRDRATFGSSGCRSVTVKERLPDGSVAVRRKSSC